MRVERIVRPSRVHVGGDARVDLEVDDPGSVDSPQLLLTDVFDDGRRAGALPGPGLKGGQKARAGLPGPDQPARPLLPRPGVAHGHRPVRPRAPQLDRRPAGRGDHLPPRPRAPPAAGRSGPAAQRFAVRVRFHAPASTARSSSPCASTRSVTTCAGSTGGRRPGPASWSYARTRRSGSRARSCCSTRDRADDEESFEAAVEATASVVTSSSAARCRSRCSRRTGAPSAPPAPVAGTGSASRRCSSTSSRWSSRAAVDSLTAIARPLRAARRRGLLVVVMGSLEGPAFDQIAALGAPAAPLVLVTTRPDPEPASHASRLARDRRRHRRQVRERLGRGDDQPGPHRRPDEPVTRPARSELYAAAALAALTIAAALGLGRGFIKARSRSLSSAPRLLPHAVGAVARWRRWSGSCSGS